MTRTPNLALEEMTLEQRRIYEDIVASRGTFFNGPFPPLLHQPRICEPTHQLGEFVRYHTSLGQRLSEFAILVVARHWDCDFEWHQHAAIALCSEVSAATIESLRTGARPASLREDERVIYDFATTLLEQHRVPTDLYERATTLFGIVGVVELTALLGYYTLLALSLNAHELSLPPGVEPSLKRRSDL